jgi:hypothetical protein
MIAPRRREKTSSGEEIYNGSVAIACGALGGFSGFFNKSFREHDFFLGRANCQSFLRKYFRVRLENGVPVNPLFAEGYSKEAIERFKFQDPDEQAALLAKNEDPQSASWYVPIIPDVYMENKLYDEIPLKYPKYDIADLDKHKKAMLSRFKLVAKSIKNKWWVNVIFFFKGKAIYESVRETIEKDFRLWKLLK